MTYKHKRTARQVGKDVLFYPTFKISAKIVAKLRKRRDIETTRTIFLQAYKRWILIAPKKDNGNTMDPQLYQYIDPLNSAQIRDTQSDSHQHWGGGGQLEERINRLQNLMNSGGPDLLRVVGLGLKDNKSLEILSSLKLYGLWLLHPDLGLLKGLGLGAIFTRESNRGQGLAFKLIQNVLENGKGQGVHFAFLFSDIDPTYYQNFGFRNIECDDIEIDVNQIPTLVNSCLATNTFRSINDPLTEEKRQNLYNSYQKNCAKYSFFRSSHVDQFYRNRNAPPLSNGKGCVDLFTNINGQQFYINFYSRNGILNIQEFATDSFSPNNPNNLLYLGFLGQLASEYQCHKIESWSVLFDPNILQQWKSVMTMKKMKDAIPMIASLNGNLPNEELEKIQLSKIDYF